MASKIQQAEETLHVPHWANLNLPAIVTDGAKAARAGAAESKKLTLGALHLVAHTTVTHA
jgi:hypothetical protein